VRIKLDSQYQNDKNLVVVYIADDGTITEMPTIIADGYAVFETTHFSHYALVAKTSSVSTTTASAGAAPTIEKPKTDDSRSLPTWAFWAVAACVVVIAGLVVLQKRKKAA